MSTPATEPSGRERLAAMQAAEARATKRKRVIALLAALLAIVLAIVAVMWGVSKHHQDEKDKAAQSAKASAATVHHVQTIPASHFDEVGFGSAERNPFTAAPNQPDLTKDGKPRIVYIGAEFCPYCAMERWAFVAALSRFGTFDGLKGAVSSPNEGPVSNIQTMTFRDAHYTSPYISLTTYETTDRMHNPLQKVDDADNKLFEQLNPKGGIPWINWGGTSTGGLDYDGTQLVGKTSEQIDEALKDPDSDIARGVLGAANVETAKICTLTHNQPAKVCNADGVKNAKAKAGL